MIYIERSELRNASGRPRTANPMMKVKVKKKKRAHISPHTTYATPSKGEDGMNIQVQNAEIPTGKTSTLTVSLHADIVFR
jgi:hypothetical protein